MPRLERNWTRKANPGGAILALAGVCTSGSRHRSTRLTAQAIERLLTTAVVDNNSSVSPAVFISPNHIDLSTHCS